MTTGSILVIGRSGQVATALSAINTSSRFSHHCLGRPIVDLSEPDRLRSAIDTIRPVLVINAAAYTAVDRAESEAELAHQINTEGPANLAALCGQAGLPLIHLSTDYVFDGTSDTPYSPDDPINPQGVYGASKAAGEEAVRDKLQQHIILRTSWVYSEGGHNFVNTMLRLAQQRTTLDIVDDQTGTPTYAADLASALEQIAAKILDCGRSAPWGTYHLTNQGQTSWYGFAREIFEIAQTHGHPTPTLKPISTSDYPTSAKRPAYSVLDTGSLEEAFGVRLPPWQNALHRCLQNILDRKNEDAKGGGE